ncbi:cupin domain-containing protein [bacterium]|nr:MAG: cupin domain-containing protein [bacterium]
MTSDQQPLLQRTSLEGIWMWSRWQHERSMNFNSFYLRGEESIVVDPLAIEEVDLAAIRSLGGAQWIVITNRDHERQSRAVAAALGARIAAPALDAPLLSAPVDRKLHDGERVGRARVVSLEGQKSPGEAALHVPDVSAVILGDALLGDPPGALRMLPDEKLGDSTRAALSLRSVWALRPRNLLVGDGACIFGNATEAIRAYLESRRDVYVNRINIDHLTWEEPHDEPGRFGGACAEIGRLVGAQTLGYRLVRLPAGKTWVPLHWHQEDEELYFVVDGEATLRTTRGEYAVRRGDFIAFPAGPGGAHQLRNDGEHFCTILMLAGNAGGGDVCCYPDSHKVLVGAGGPMLRSEPTLDYYDGEPEA